MGAVDYGTQTITFDFFQRARSEGFNRLNFRIAESGVYDGGELTRIDDTHVQIAPVLVLISDLVNETTTRIETAVAISWPIDNSVPYVVLRFTWVNAEDNFMDPVSVAEVDILPGDIVLGKCVYDGAVMRPTMDYTRRTLPSKIKTVLDKESFIVTPKDPVSNVVAVSAGTAFINGNLTSTPAGDSPVIAATVLGRIDIVYVDEAGAIAVREGVDAGAPVAPNLPLDGIPLAYITRGAGRADITGDEIEGINPNKNFNSSRVDSSVIAISQDFLATELEHDKRFFVNCAAGSITLGLFNGSIRNGEKLDIVCIGAANRVNLELVADGTTDITLSSRQTITLTWDDTNSEWKTVSRNNLIYDYIVETQEDFNFIIERTGANAYKFRDAFKSIYFKFLTGGYLCYGATSFLSGGDLYGVIRTNNCANLIFEEGAYLHMGNERSYLEINTTGAYLLNADIRGLGAVASAIQYSYRIANVTNVFLENCKTSNRLSNAAFYCFSAVAVLMETVKLINCSVTNMESSNVIVGFIDLYYLTNCQVRDLRNTTAGTARGFFSCYYLNACQAYDIDSSISHSYGMYSCFYLTNCKADKIDHSGAVAGQNAFGFNSCTYLSNCSASDIDTNGAGGIGVGFDTCSNIACCAVTTSDYGFDTCTEISASKAYTNSKYGFAGCLRITSSWATNNANDGFNGCTGVASCYALSNTQQGFVNCQRVSVSLAQSNSQWGFNSCKSLHSNSSTGNAAGQYTASYADSGVANAAADTAAGGYNA